MTELYALGNELATSAEPSWLILLLFIQVRQLQKSVEGNALEAKQIGLKLLEIDKRMNRVEFYLDDEASPGS